MFKLFLYCKTILLLIALTVSKTSIGQDKNIGSWTIANANIILNNKWNIFLDPHLYSDKQYNKFYYYEIKGTVGYKLSKHINVAAGTGKYITYQREGNLQLPIQTNETRLFEQLFFTHNINQLKIDHRFQLEQRFFKSLYRNRLRYRANLTFHLISLRLKKILFFSQLMTSSF